MHPFWILETNLLFGLGVNIFARHEFLNIFMKLRPRLVREIRRAKQDIVAQQLGDLGDAAIFQFAVNKDPAALEVLRRQFFA